jgi:Ca2+/Na+ antiporter
MWSSVGKIDIAASAEQKSIKWRRSFILSVVICVLVFVLVVMHGNLPYWPYMYAAVIISTFVLYFNFNYYSYHYYNRPTENIKKSTELLFEKISTGQC